MNIVLIGGGHSHSIFLKKFGMNPVRDINITLISPESLTPYSGMIPGLISGVYSEEECHIDIRHLCNFSNSKFIKDSVHNIDLINKYVMTHSTPPIHYDYLSIDIGITPDILNIDLSKNIAPIKPISEFTKKLNNFSESIHNIINPKICIIGGGAGGIEIALSLHHKFSKAKKEVELFLIHKGQNIVESYRNSVRNKILNTLKNKNIQVIVNEKVSKITDKSDSLNLSKIHCESGNTYDSNFIVFTTHASPPKWISNVNIKKDKNGFILVNTFLQSTSNPEIFATGDIANIENYNIEKSGVYAVRQGSYLFSNLIALTQNQKLKHYIPQKYFLSLLSTGDNKAIAKRNYLSWGPSNFLWKWKDYIDKKFMNSFVNLPYGMKSNSGLMFKNGDIRCTGCGSKIGESVLHNALSRVKNYIENKEIKEDIFIDKISKILQNNIASHNSSKIIIGLNDGDDSAVLSLPLGKYTVNTLDFFKPLLKDNFISGKITANHCLNDIYSLGALPDSAMALITIPRMNEKESEEEIFQHMAGLVEVLEMEKCKLIGGHTNEGLETIIGLSCTGLVDSGSELRKENIKKGDILILSKPLGTGLIFACDMRNKSKAKWIDSAIFYMLQSNRRAMEIMKESNVRAITDISGFGLIGHLYKALQKTNLSAVLNLSNIPMIDGVKNILKDFPLIKSSLFPENWNSFYNHITLDKNLVNFNIDILFDPQTSGALLGFIPSEMSYNCISNLKKNGYTTSIIGEVTQAEFKIKII
jgi:selenide, water dikinase